MAFKVRIKDPTGDGGVTELTAQAAHVSVSEGLVVFNDAGTQVLVIPLELLISAEKTK